MAKWNLQKWLMKQLDCLQMLGGYGYMEEYPLAR
jgi:alkylation response protein AidB-like acyl-CoA dehydrogenase